MAGFAEAVASGVPMKGVTLFIGFAVPFHDRQRDDVEEQGDDEQRQPQREGGERLGAVELGLAGQQIDDLLDILQNEFQQISQFIKKDVNLESLWSVTYNKYDYHLIHNHGHKGFTGILYMDIKENVPPTTYVQPWTDPYSDMTIYNPLEVKEGTITVIPRFVLHFSQSNNTDFKKRIIAFDLNFNL